jgi:uncharacterized protein YjiS (DUF1127 family)
MGKRMMNWGMEMTMASVNTSHSNLAQLAQRAVAVPAEWLNRIRERRRLMGLLQLPDYLLKDIGLQRHEIAREGLKHFWE